LFHINEGPRCAPFYEDITNDGKRDLFLGNYAGGLAFFNSVNVNGVGIDELWEDEDVLLYPNPTSDNVTVTINDAAIREITISVFDILGNEVYKIMTYNKSIQLDVSKFSQGVYFIKIQNQSETQLKFITRRFVIQ
jgi:hypothetical protein